MSKFFNNFSVDRGISQKFDYTNHIIWNVPLPLFSRQPFAYNVLLDATQESIGQLYDQNQTFPLGQISPRQK